MARIQKVCLVCGNTFSVPPSRGKAKFCSRKCYHKGQKFGLTSHPKRVKKYLVKRCLNCGKGFEVQPSRSFRKYCSPKCYGEAQKARKTKHRFKTHPKMKICPVCGKKFRSVFFPNTSKYQQTCSLKCAGKYFIGFRDPKYKGKRLTDSMKELIRERDEYKCRLCGIKQEKSISLDIHHIDLNNRNNNPRNLLSLCHRCHATLMAKGKDGIILAIELLPKKTVTIGRWHPYNSESMPAKWHRKHWYKPVRNKFPLAHGVEEIVKS